MLFASYAISPEIQELLSQIIAEDIPQFVVAINYYHEHGVLPDSNPVTVTEPDVFDDLELPFIERSTFGTISSITIKLYAYRYKQVSIHELCPYL